ncbi:MAG TPA: Y-family DNA polymerase [Candidatus Saccharimonadales bacterium]|nr:Y-family DNA polymerase [Candidatus Saccharimonadales bacterium]
MREDRQSLRADDELDASEQRSATYQAYGERAAQLATTFGADSSTGVPSSARKQGRATQVFALVDCNNFFVSCERLFRPDLENRPVVVLSSNDGCVVSRSNEAKAIGIPMGAPAFKYRQLFRAQGVTVLSANFELYGDISQRLTQVLASLTPRIEIYSVDESFVELSTLSIDDYQQWGHQLRTQIWHDVGVPVSIGIAPSKTLAKLAGDRAKKVPELAGVLDLASLSSQQRQPYLLQTPVSDVWGIGWRLTPRLKAEGIHTAADVASMPPRYAQQLMGIHGRQLVTELRGQCCQPLTMTSKVRQSLMHGRMFGEDTDQFGVIEAAIASLTARAAASLRREGLLAGSAAIHLSTNRHKPGYQRVSRFVHFHTPTADTGRLISQLVASTEHSFNPRASYHRLVVLFQDLIERDRVQTDLFGELEITDGQRVQARLAAIDGLNQQYGRGTIRFAAEALSDAWQPKRAHRSPRYTSDWDELPVINCDAYERLA